MDKNLHTYLISEYERALEEPLYVKINGKDVLMPFVYALKYSNEKQPIISKWIFSITRMKTFIQL